MKEGKIFSSSLFLFRFLKSDTPRYAIVAPKGIFKKAVDRNKFRRIGYNILRSIKIKSGTGAFIYKKPTSEATTIEIKGNILLALKKTGIYE